MTPEQREDELRRRDARFRRLVIEERVALSAQVYGHLADCSFLLDVIDHLRRVIAHTPTRPMPALDSPWPALPTAPGIPSPRDDLPWSDPANRA